MSKDFIIEKIANVAELKCDNVDKKNIALKVASQMLKIAAEKQKDLEVQIAKVSLENINLKNEKIAMAKKEDIVETVDKMFLKGLVRKDDIEDKITELESMDDKSLILLKNTINSMPEKIANEYVSNLNFLFSDTNMKEKENLSSAINGFLK